MSLKVTRLQLTQPLKSPTAFSRLNDSRGNARGKKYGVLHDKRNNACKCGENDFFFWKKNRFFRPIGFWGIVHCSPGGGGFIVVFFRFIFQCFSCCISVLLLLWLWQKTMLNKRCPCDQTPYRVAGFVISGLFIILFKNGKSLLWTVYIITVQKTWW